MFSFESWKGYDLHFSLYKKLTATQFMQVTVRCICTIRFTITTYIHIKKQPVGISLVAQKNLICTHTVDIIILHIIIVFSRKT